MVLVGEVKEPAGNTTLLENVKQTQSLRDGKTVVEIVVDNQMGGGESQDTLRRTGVKAAVVITHVPERPVELALHEPELLGGDLGVSNECTVVRDERLEFAAQIAALNPVHHEPAVAGTGGDAAVGVDVVEVVADIFPGLNEVFIGRTA